MRAMLHINIQPHKKEACQLTAGHQSSITTHNLVFYLYMLIVSIVELCVLLLRQVGISMSERLSVNQQALYAVANHALAEHNTNVSLGRTLMLMLMMQPPGGILVVYMWGGQRGGQMELHIMNPKKYMSLRFYTQKNTWYQNFLPQKNYKT